MKKFFKWTSIVLGALVVVLTIAICVIVEISASRGEETYDVHVAPIELPTDEASLAEGERLVTREPARRQ